MSLDKGYFVSLKSRNSKNFYLTSNNISKNKNLSKFPNKSISYNNELIKNNKYSNYKNNIATNTYKNTTNNNNYNKSNINSTSKNYNNSQTYKNKEKINQTYTPLVTITSGESTINSTSKGAKRQEPFFYEPSSKNNTINTPESAGQKMKILNFFILYFIIIIIQLILNQKIKKID